MFVLFLVCVFAISQGIILDSLVPHHEVCYGDLGCFNNGPPFFSVQRLLSLVPESPAKIRTQFLLYTRSKTAAASHEDILTANQSSISASMFDGSLPTKFIIHGFTHDGHKPWVQHMKDELLKKENVNVIVVDWKHGATLPYDQATANTRVVGAQVAQLIDALMNVTSATAGSFHIIGHSLGAHIAGYAGERVSHIGRITGLDPANPYFQGTDSSVRLDPSDAVFVDVIHTDGSSVLELGFGAAQAMGHVDFYPNGGKDQPGCATGALGKLGQTAWTAVTKLDYYAAEGAVACSHERSFYYFTESINSSCPFTAYPCSSADEFRAGNCLKCNGNGCSQMGYNADKFPARGSLYLETEASSTYCDYSYLFNVSAFNSFDGKLTVTVTGTHGIMGPVHLMGQNEVHASGTSFSKLIRYRKDIGDVKSVTVTYDKTSALVAGLLYPDVWDLTGASLWSADHQKGYPLCAYNKGVHNHQSVTFGLQGTC